MRKHKLRNDINTNTRGLTNHCGLQVNINGPGNMATWAPSVKECVEWVFTRVGFHWGLHQDSIRADTMFEAEQLPAGISNLDTCLAHMDWDALPLDGKITTELEEHYRKVVLEKRNLKECEFIFKWCVPFSINFIWVNCHCVNLVNTWLYSTHSTTRSYI